MSLVKLPYLILFLFSMDAAANDELGCEVVALKTFASEHLNSGKAASQFQILLDSYVNQRQIQVSSEDPMGSYSEIGVVKKLSTNLREDRGRVRKEVDFTLETKSKSHELSLLTNGPDVVQFWSPGNSKLSAEQLKELREFSARLSGNLQAKFEVLLNSLTESRKIRIKSNHPMGTYDITGIVEEVKTYIDENRRPKMDAIFKIRDHQDRVSSHGLIGNGPDLIQAE